MYKAYGGAAMAGISEAEVHEAIRQLKAAGSRLSTHTIRKQLGDTGSLSTIEKYRATFQSPPPTLANLVREEVARVLAEVGMPASLATRMAAAEADGGLTTKAVALLTTRLESAEQRIDKLETQFESALNHRKGEDERASRRARQRALHGKTFE